MSRITPLPFQEKHINVLVERFRALKLVYERLGKKPKSSDLTILRKNSACLMLQAPTGIGKTLIAAETLSRFSPEDRIVWFWFAPFAGVVVQSRLTLKAQAPGLTHLDIETDRQAAKLVPGAIFVLTWQTVAARSRDSRLARQSGDVGMGLDDLVSEARMQGFRIGVVVDEAHHGFIRATEARKFFCDVLAPDYVLLMTATPRDTDATTFAQQTGYKIGSNNEWASVTRAEGVEAELLKKSVKAARFIARNQDDAQLLAFEEVAMSECAAMHRQIKKTLKDCDIDLVPLMLVQVPNGGASLDKARKYITETLRFNEDAVKVHSADEPDPNLLALARDPKVEVLIFKMAIATGFDAPRAFTLAALRGTRDTNFGIQVVGRIMRVHRIVQGRLSKLPPLLHFGYVFLANSAAQEGLENAAREINKMPDQLASATTSTVITVVADEARIQVVKPGETFSLLADGSDDDKQNPHPSFEAQHHSGGNNELHSGSMHPSPAQGALFDRLLANEGSSSKFAHGYATQSSLTEAFTLDAQQTAHVYHRKKDIPTELITEKLPPATDDFEHRLVAHIDFSRVLGDRLKVRTRITERVTDVFSLSEPEDHDIWAVVSPTHIAEKARQIAFAFDDIDRREFLAALKGRFRNALLHEGHEVPESDEELTRQLELVLVRNDNLLKDAHKRLRAEEILVTKAFLPEAIESSVSLLSAKRNAYGVFPENMSPQEREFAELLDTSKDVEWWHRNPSGAYRTDAVSLYRWSGGVGFFPDFVVKVTGRSEGLGIVLNEVKGPHLQQYDRAKAAARHAAYGRVIMVGKEGAEGDFRLWRLTTDDTLVNDGPFEVLRLRYS